MAFNDWWLTDWLLVGQISQASRKLIRSGWPYIADEHWWYLSDVAIRFYLVMICLNGADWPTEPGCWLDQQKLIRTGQPYIAWKYIPDITVRFGSIMGCLIILPWADQKELQSFRNWPGPPEWWLVIIKHINCRQLARHSSCNRLARVAKSWGIDQACQDDEGPINTGSRWLTRYNWYYHLFVDHTDNGNNFFSILAVLGDLSVKF